MFRYTATYTLKEPDAKRSAEQSGLVLWYEATEASPKLVYHPRRGHTADPGYVTTEPDGPGQPKLLNVKLPPSQAAVIIDVRIVTAKGIAKRPRGVSIRDLGPGDPQGTLSFPDVTVADRTLTLTDRDHGSGARTTYEFQVLFNDSRSTLGLLDPKIHNT